jgi:hypothetical protein
VVPAECHPVGVCGDRLVGIPDGIHFRVERRQVITHHLQHAQEVQQLGHEMDLMMFKILQRKSTSNVRML